MKRLLDVRAVVFSTRLITTSGGSVIGQFCLLFVGSSSRRRFLRLPLVASPRAVPEKSGTLFGIVILLLLPAVRWQIQDGGPTQWVCQRRRRVY